MEVEKVDSSLEKQGYMGERREGLAVMKGGSIQRTTGGGLFACWMEEFDIYRLKVESKAKVEDIGERRWVQVVKGREDWMQNVGGDVCLQGEAGGKGTRHEGSS